MDPVDAGDVSYYTLIFETMPPPTYTHTQYVLFYTQDKMRRTENLQCLQQDLISGTNMLA